MNGWKKYMLLFFTLFFIILGAVMPELAFRMQDAQISGLRKKKELSTVNLTLRSEGDVGPTLQMMSKGHTESVWEGETVLTKADVTRAAQTVMETMDEYGLLPEGDLEQLLKAEGNVEPQLLVAEDGSSALIWVCTWDCNQWPLFTIDDATQSQTKVVMTSTSQWPLITIDDATGKAVRVLVGNALMDNGIVDSSTVEDMSLYVEKWHIFLQDYYDIELMDMKEQSFRSEDRLSTSFDMYFSSNEDAIDYELSLKMTGGYVLFNYQ